MSAIAKTRGVTAGGWRRRVMLVAAAAFSVAGCSSSCAPTRPPSKSAPIADESAAEVVLTAASGEKLVVKVEVARTDEQRSKGLMYRQRLDAGRGMLFLFDQPQPLTFWMHNTYIPLDMIFITKDRRVLGYVENAEPLTDTPRQVAGESQFVLEVPGGWAAQHHVAPGMPVTFSGVEWGLEQVDPTIIS